MTGEKDSSSAVRNLSLKDESIEMERPMDRPMDRPVDNDDSFVDIESGGELSEVKKESHDELHLGTLLTKPARAGKKAAFSVVHEAGAIEEEAVEDFQGLTAKIGLLGPKKGGANVPEEGPDLSCLVSRNLLSSILVYGIADMREFSRKNEQFQLWELPMYQKELLNALASCSHEMEKQANFNSEFYGSALASLAVLFAEKDLAVKIKQSPRRPSALASLVPEKEEDNVSLEVFDDDHSKTELVYAIDVDDR